MIKSKDIDDIELALGIINGLLATNNLNNNAPVLRSVQKFLLGYACRSHGGAVDKIENAIYDSLGEP